jgi:DNA helicase IV
VTKIGVVRHRVDDFSDWRRKFDQRMDIRKNNGWSGHELYYDEARREAYVVHTVKDDKLDMAKQHMENFKQLGKRAEMKPSGNPDHSIIPKGKRIESVTY